MFFLWFVLLHALRVAERLHHGNAWNSALVALALCGGDLVLAGTPAKRKSRVPARAYPSKKWRAERADGT
jgi:hypothetical protein